MSNAPRRLGSLVYEPALTVASAIDKSFLVAVTKDDRPSTIADIQRRLDGDVDYASQCRLRLIAAELIELIGHGYVDLVLSYRRESFR